MSQSTPSPLRGMPIVDVPHPRAVARSPRPAADRSEPSGPPEVALPSIHKTMVGMAPIAAEDAPPPQEDAPSAREEEAPRVEPLPAPKRAARTIVGVASPDDWYRPA